VISFGPPDQRSRDLPPVTAHRHGILNVIARLEQAVGVIAFVALIVSIVVIST
jgi:hypothetical protein